MIRDAINNGLLQSDLDCAGFDLLNFSGGGGGGTVVIPWVSGTTPLTSGQNYIDVVFSAAQADASWTFMNLQVANTVDAVPLNIMPGVVTVKTTTGFRLLLNGSPDSSNYILDWKIEPSAGAAFGAYALSGPGIGEMTVPSRFTVELSPGAVLTGTVSITPHDGGAGGTFTPASVELSTAAPSATFTYTNNSVTP